jgi:hypothetical protein
VEADENPRPVDLLDDAVEPLVLPGRVGGAAVEREGDLVGAEACAEGYSGKFGVVPSGVQPGSGTVVGLPSVSASGIAW